ncbi:MAG: type I 3-dehydroquinate dehydratase [Lachnospiraceae bacterium]|nr:type I 3-dehydroquinate dehydratase [Lachnospiraceae bacterium]
MESLKIRNMELGAGRPKICVPLTGSDQEQLQAEAEAAMKKSIDLVEWRGDCFCRVHDLTEMEQTAKILRQQMGDCPILFTCRTEDGRFSISIRDYIELNKRMIATGCIDLVDVELFMGDMVCRELVEYAHAHHVAVVISNHEFEKTPDVDVMVRRLQSMRYLGADVPKIAVMPKNNRDVLKLLQATDTFNQWFGDCPIITMSMGKMGVISRLCGETFGSALTFATVGKASAPGQISVDEVETILDILHQ